MTVDDSQSEDDLGTTPIDELMDDYITRLQQGQRPSVSEYCGAHPEHEKEIRELFPMLSVIEQQKPREENAPESETSFPKQIGGYILIREIGRGGMGVIYEARDDTVGRRVALKILPQRLADDSRALARFRREAKAIASLHHTNVVPLFEFESDHGRLFLVMQLIEGASVDRLIAQVREDSERRLDTTDIEPVTKTDSRADDWSASNARLKGARLSENLRDFEDLVGGDKPERFLAIATLGFQIASALEHAHQRGIIHRDVKPSNILVDRTGVAWLTDFGLAKTNDDDLTQTGDFLGTLRYAAPEIFLGDCDERSDLYALGLTLYELLVLRPAYQSNDRLQLIRDIGNSSPTPLEKLNDRIPIDLATIISKSIDHDPEGRYFTAGEMANDLQRFVRDEPILARKLSIVERSRRWGRKNTELAYALSVVVLLTIVTVVGAVAASFREARLRNRAEIAGRSAERSRMAMRHGLYFAEMNLAGQAAASTSGTQRINELLSHWKRRPGVEDLRGWEWDYLKALNHRYEAMLYPDTDISEIPEASWSPDGSLLALAHNDKRISIWDASEGRQLRLLDGHAARVRSLAWSPDGKWIASGGLENQLIVWETESYELVRVFHLPQAEILSVRWSPNSDLIACGNGKSVFLVEPESDSEPLLLGREDNLYIVTNLQWSPDGTRLFAGNWWENEGGVWDVVRKERVAGIPGRFVRWGDQTQVVNWITANSTGEIFVWEPGEDHPIQIFSGHETAIRSFAWSPDGTRLLSTGDDRSVRVWDASNGEIQERLCGHQSSVLSAFWNPAGDRIVSMGYDKFAIVWKLGAGPIHTLGDLESRVDEVAWQANGQHLAAVSRRGKVVVWNCQEQRVQKVVLEEGGRSIQWSRKGDRLAVSRTNGSFEIWNVETDSIELSVDAHRGSANGIAWSPEGEWIATVGGDAFLRLWDLSQPDQPFDSRPILAGSQCVSWSPDGRLVAVGKQDGELLLFHPEQHEPIRKWNVSVAPVLDVAWSPDGKEIAAAASRDVVSIWRVEDGSFSQSLKGHHGPVIGVDWNVAGNRLATSSEDGTVRIWEPSSGAETLRLSGIRRQGVLRCIRWGDKGRALASGNALGGVTVWRIGNRDERQLNLSN